MNLITIAQMVLNSFAKPKQHISIREIPSGRVLDIGGGGEGIIAQLGGARICAIDKYLSEIYEARHKAPDTLWLTADAINLPYKTHSFDNATAFFSCMYMSNAVKAKVFQETLRVLKPGGELWIWDTVITTRSKVFAIRLQIDLAGIRVANTAYGVKAKNQSAASISTLLQTAGYTVETVAEHRHWFLLKARQAPEAIVAREKISTN